jgi:hypothetical protein
LPAIVVAVAVTTACSHQGDPSRTRESLPKADSLTIVADVVQVFTPRLFEMDDSNGRLLVMVERDVRVGHGRYAVTGRLHRCDDRTFFRHATLPAGEIRRLRGTRHCVVASDVHRE